jgi:2-polyprenyl-6-methoxyphenol hydroxylase-like FAD-dependent oxidoreductase
MAAEDAYVLVHEMLSEDVPIEARLMRYSRRRYARCAFVYTFSQQWLEEEQSVRTEEDLAQARMEMALNASSRIAASDRILDTPIV